MDISIKSTAPGLDPMAQRTRPGVAAATENRGAAGRTEVAARPAEIAPTRSAATTPQRVEHENRARPAEPTREQALSALSRQAYAARLESAPELSRTEEEAGRIRAAETRPGESAEKPAWVTELLKDFRLAMGTDNPKFDFNGDGRVGQEDLEMLMKRLSEHLPQIKSNDGAEIRTRSGEAGETTYQMDPELPDLQGLLTHFQETAATQDDQGISEQIKQDILGLLAAWGSDDPKFDYNGSGKVGVEDLVQYLDQLAQKIGAGNGPPEQSEPGELEQQMLDLLQAWGSSDPNFDFDGNGKVDVFDLLALLDGQSGKT